MEVRHVETNLLSQTIPGSNLQCLFADTPPLTTTATDNANGGSQGRDEILIASDDRVMELQMTQIV